MAHVRLRGTLKQLASDRADHEVDGTTVTEVVGALVREHPALDGWILDERGHLREHLNVFVNGEQAAADAPVTAHDRVEVIPAISGGST